MSSTPEEPTNPFAPPKSETAQRVTAGRPDPVGRMYHPMISRTMAVLVLAFPMGWSMAEMNQSDMTRYRSLGHHELLAVLEDNASMGLVGCVVTSIGMVGFIFLAVAGLSLGIDRVLGAMTRREPRSSLR